MRPQSAKAKGRRLQQEVRDAILAAFPQLEKDDVRSTSMGAGGTDILLSPAARQLFPFAVECKNTESINIWKALDQATSARMRVGLMRGHTVTELVVFRRNHTPAYAALPLDALLDLVKRANGGA